MLHFQLILGKPLETFVVLSYFNYFCVICSMQTAQSLSIWPINLICNGSWIIDYNYGCKLCPLFEKLNLNLTRVNRYFWLCGFSSRLWQIFTK